ncbi:MAG: LysR family transcriptional regulator ArgP [Paracoccaceae bacterium]
MQFDPHHLSALAVILRTGSFEQAASELSVTPSAISQRIKALEEKVGTTLIQRGTPCIGTPSGVRLAKHAEDVGLLEAQLSRDLSLAPVAQRTRLRIAVNADSLATWLMPGLAAVPDTLFDLVLDDQDWSAEWLERGEVSAAVTAAGANVPGCTRYPLGVMRYVATASPGFVKQWFPGGVTAEALAQAPNLVFNARDGLQRSWLQAKTGKDLAPPSHYLPSTHAFVDAARAGLGWGMNPETLVRGPIRNRRLVSLDADLPLDVALEWQVSRVLAPALEPVTAAIRKAAAEGLLPIPKD